MMGISRPCFHVDGQTEYSQFQGHAQYWLYSPDLPPSDYHLFRSLAHGLADQHFRSYEEVKNWIDSWITSKDDQFFQRGIRTMPERWEKVVASDGQCFES
ncbi:mariner Mos1 transposase [Trichonephila clavipes]|uniref:Mariner Mos1 transposase n=1 Tax=Trichonephila clavipes TaxID=2585209 RepID=A0A8X6W684_TRICX|nr:mariner Mos1 transposase [Trichonephila clavipes]